MKPTKRSAKETYNRADAVVMAEIVRASAGFEDRGPLVQLNVKEVLKGAEHSGFHYCGL